MRKYLVISGVVVVIALGAFFVFAGNHSIDIANPKSPKTTPKPSIAPLSGLECENAASRPWAVMMPSDPEARPLAGIGQADMVFEMPVTESGVTRMMMVFQCTHPSEFGSIRSAREDFVPFVLGLDAIYMHWGGEHGVLAELDSNILDNINCLQLDGSICLRKKGVPMPHDGYSTSELFTKQAAKLKYNLLDGSVVYEHTKGKSQGAVNPPALFNEANRVTWTYNAQSNLYYRYRTGKPEVDRGTGKQVMASNIAVLHTTSTYVNILYNRVKTVGSGSATLYQNGIAIPAKWQKTTEKSKLMLLDTGGKEIPFVPGNTWFEIVTE